MWLESRDEDITRVEEERAVVREEGGPELKSMAFRLEFELSPMVTPLSVYCFEWKTIFVGRQTCIAPYFTTTCKDISNGHMPYLGHKSLFDLIQSSS
jgi:hypothetical protein